MKVRKLISMLEHAIEKHGDIEIYMITPGNDPEEMECEIRGISFNVGIDEKVESALICDEDTFDAFVEDGENIDDL